MSTAKNIQFHIGETWQIFFIAHNADNSVMDLTGASVFFRISAGSVPLITVDDAIVVSDPVTGSGVVTITPAMQVTAAIGKKTYNYELKVVLADFVSIQCIGTLQVLPSLFSV